MSSLEDGHERARPRTRGDCVNGPRPCPWVSCRHTLLIEIRGEHVHEMGGKDGPAESCSLDVADLPRPRALQEVGRLLGVTRERVRQIESKALAKLRRHLPIVHAEEWLPDQLPYVENL